MSRIRNREFGEGSSPSRSPFSPLHPSNLPPDFYYFYPKESPLQSPSNYPSSHDRQDVSIFASPQFNEIQMQLHQDQFAMYGDNAIEDFQKMKISGKTEVENQVDPMGYSFRHFESIDENSVSRGFQIGVSSGFTQRVANSVSKINPCGQVLNHETESDFSSSAHQWMMTQTGVVSYNSSLIHHQRSLGIDTFSPKKSLNINGVENYPKHSPPLFNDRYNRGYIYAMATDQQGCLELVEIIEKEIPQDLSIIFNEIGPYVTDLMMHPFGNYLMQKILDKCNEIQRTVIIGMITAVPEEFIQISRNIYGTRVIQKLIGSIKTVKQLSLVRSVLRYGFGDLIRDSNGNHVIQRCLKCFSVEDNKFIFDAAATFCSYMAIDQHAYRVLLECINVSSGQQLHNLLLQISRFSLYLAQDQFGNYVVQSVVKSSNSLAVSTMLSCLRGHYVQLSMQKFSSHVVEKCLKHCPESCLQIIIELITFHSFSQLLNDPYANFVIQTALNVTQGFLHDKLVETIRAYQFMRYNPYCRKIFSKIA